MNFEGIRRLFIAPINSNFNIIKIWVSFFILITFIYIGAINGGFIWDDITFIINNPIIQANDAFYKIWFSKDSVDYWPIIYSLFRFEWLSFGLNPIGYHLVNFAIHSFSCTILWRILVRLNCPYPLFVAFIFCIHPINVEAVAWIFQAKTILSAAFVLASTLFYLKISDGKGWRNYFLSLTFFLLANLTKISVVTWPLIFLGYELFISHYKISLKIIKKVAPFFIISLIFGILNVLWYTSYTTLSASEVIRDDNFLSRFLGAGQNIVFYLYKALIPLNLNFVYTRWNILEEGIWTWLPSSMIVSLLVYFIIKKKSLPSFRNFLLYLLITMFPVLGFIDIYFMRYSWVADHYFYLSLIGLIVAVITFVSNQINSKKIKIIIASIISIIYIFLSMIRSTVFLNEEVLWEDTLKKNPDAWFVHNTYGLALATKGNLNDGIAHFNQALKIKPDYIEAHNNLGDALIAQGKLDEAVLQFNEAIKIKPDFAEAHYNLGFIFVVQGKIPEALYQYSEAIRLKPKYVEAHYNIGLALMNSGKINEAASHFEEAIKIKPEFADAHNSYGFILFTQSKNDEANFHFAEAIKIKPNFAEAHFNIGRNLASQGKINQAIDHFTEVLKINPHFIEAHYNLGLAFLSQKRPSEAIDQFNEVLKISPNLPKIHYNIIIAYLMLENKSAAMVEYKILKSIDLELANTIYKKFLKN